jgi:hypothetical protein
VKLATEIPAQQASARWQGVEELGPSPAKEGQAMQEATTKKTGVSEEERRGSAPAIVRRRRESSSTPGLLALRLRDV